MAITASVGVAVGDLIGSVISLDFPNQDNQRCHSGGGWLRSLKWGFASSYELYFFSAILLINLLMDSFHLLHL